MKFGEYVLSNMILNIRLWGMPEICFGVLWGDRQAVIYHSS